MDLSPQEYFNHMVKVLLVGDSKVGKTALINRFCDDIFSKEHIATIGKSSK